MKLLLIRPLGSNFSVLSEKVTIEILPFDSEKFKGRLQEFVSSLADYSFDGIIVPDSLDDSLNYLGLELCTRIRLSSNELGDKSYSTFFIYSSKDPQEIYKSQLLQKANTTASLFFTEGTFYFNDNDLVKILLENNSNFNLLNKDNFKGAFFEVIQIKKNPDFGNHTIANIWGAIRLAEVTGNRKFLDNYLNSNTNIRINLSDLYFKFLLNQNSYSDVSPASVKTIDSKGKNILLIDDEVNKGWGLILKNILIGANFENINPGVNFINDAKTKVKEKISGVSKWDLILLDLRLDENEDQVQNAFKTASEYSGAKLLSEIKSENKGVQVIMFTATNKAWNLLELQTIGVDGFFIKESPEFNKDSHFSVNNYKEFEKQINSCFKENYLRFIYNEIPKTISKWEKIKLPSRKVLADMHDGLLHIQTPSLVNSFLKSSFATLSNRNLDERFTLSVLQLFRILEIVCEYFIIESGSSKDNNLKYRFDDGGKLFNFWKGNQGAYPDGKAIPRIQQVLNIYYKQTLKVNQPLFDNLLALNEYRNKVAIHPSQRAKEESLEYLFEFDNNKFQKDIIKYFSSIVDFLESIK